MRIDRRLWPRDCGLIDDPSQSSVIESDHLVHAAAEHHRRRQVEYSVAHVPPRPLNGISLGSRSRALAAHVEPTLVLESVAKWIVPESLG